VSPNAENQNGADQWKHPDEHELQCFLGGAVYSGRHQANGRHEIHDNHYGRENEEQGYGRVDQRTPYWRSGPKKRAVNRYYVKTAIAGIDLDTVPGRLSAARRLSFDVLGLGGPSQAHLY
jgi:hypothetical protein